MSIDWSKMRPTQDRENEELVRLATARRAERDMLIKETDFYFLSDYPHPAPESIIEYRRALRDITEHPGWPKNIIWPTKPQ